MIDTTDDLYAVPRGAVVLSRAGTIAARFDATNGVVFGDDRPFPWRELALPVVVLWSPEQPAPQWDPPPPPEVDTFDQLLDLPPGSVLRMKFMHPDGHRVYEKFPDGKWRAAGSGRYTPVDRMETMLPARLLDHPRWSNA
ncbi:hypothetical protein BCA37_10630 [Mycobacterium sp. djl-10]|nr:hypothetical protein BCA37_10630 [Mycobacterium sp. djl-10]